ncbi:hypothetical protein [Nocardia sp. NPDC046763]|uniref:N-acetylmuramoyl-L-alanine amidase n=1 Tax=Nocardia sp. NPDC046763 TaxID=3155256 RepID=UPI0033C0A1C1
MPPQYTELDRMGNSASSRTGTRITNFLLHTQEGDGTAETLADYLNDPSHEASYHYTLRDGIVCDVVDTDLASWSVLDANPYTINLCFAGSRAGWGPGDWAHIDADIRIAAWLAVQDAKKYGFSTDVIAPPYQQREGLSDHRYVTECLGIGTHTDVGDNFPWTRFAGYVQEYTTGAAAVPTPNTSAVSTPNTSAVPTPAIDDVYAANPWLGTRITDGETTTPDGAGRFTQFEHGYIYWHPATGAHPIPETLWAKYQELGWEAGSLGYPVTDRTMLNGPDGQASGEVQGFQGGALYRYQSGDTYWVHGAIRDRWNRSGYENGPLGWPMSDEIPWDTGTYQDFLHGRIYWTPGQTLATVTADGTDKPLHDPYY